MHRDWDKLQATEGESEEVVNMQSVKKNLLSFERQSNQDKPNRDQT